MLGTLSQGALERIIAGEQVDNPVFQILAHKRLARTEKIRLDIFDGVQSYSFAVLARHLEAMVNHTVQFDLSIVQIKAYAMIPSKDTEIKRNVLLILGLEILVPGHQVDTVFCSARDRGSAEADTQAAMRSVASPGTAENQQDAVTAASSSSSSNLCPQAETSAATTSIAALKPYHNRWVIRARVTNKSPKRQFCNSMGKGTLFIVDLVDSSGQIRCTAFREHCDKFYDMIEMGQVYLITRCTLKPANKQFNNLANDYEMTIRDDTSIVACNEDCRDIPQVQFNFMTIDAIWHTEKDTLIDVLGFVKVRGAVENVKSMASGRVLKIRKINIVDEFNDTITLVLVDQRALEFHCDGNAVVAARGAKVGDMSGVKYLYLIASTLVQVDPDLPEAHRLRDRFKTVASTQENDELERQLDKMRDLSIDEK